MLKKLAISLNVIVGLAVVAIALVAAPGAMPATSGGAKGAPSEGIGVHGRWTIEVLNPDGTIAERREFDNALLSQGRQYLNAVMIGNLSGGKWEVELWGDTGANHPCENEAGPQHCRIGQAGGPNPGNNLFSTMTIATPTWGADTGKVVFSGSATAQRDGNVATVSTAAFACGTGTAPAACTSGAAPYDITSTTLASPINVVAGQGIAVTVKLYFS